MTPAEALALGRRAEPYLSPLAYSDDYQPRRNHAGVLSMFAGTDAEGFAVMLPDLRDPATIGCLIGLVSERKHPLLGYALTVLGYEDGWAPAVEALVSALEAAP